MRAVQRKKKYLNPSILCFKLLLYFQWPCMEMVISNRPKYTNSSYHYRVQLILFYMHTLMQMGANTHMHMSTSNEYFYCSYVAVRWMVFFFWGLHVISCSSCDFFFIFLSLFRPTNEIINLCKGWHPLTYTHTHSLVPSIKILNPKYTGYILFFVLKILVFTIQNTKSQPL